MFYLLKYNIWSTLQEQVYKTTVKVLYTRSCSVKVVHELRECIVNKWDV